SDNISELSVVLTDLNNGTTYFIWIKAKNSVGTSDFSPVSNGTPQVFAIPPQPPSAPIISICNGQLNVSWSAVQGATAYEIWLATENNATSALKHGSDIITSLSSIITGLDNGTTYFIWIKAKNSFGTSDFSPVTSGKPIANATIPSITSSNNQLTINWNTIIGADQYEVFIGTGTNLPQNVIQIIDAPITTATITGLVNGTNYNVWIRGINSTGTGLISSSVSGKPIENIGIVTLNAGNNQLTVNWSPVAGADEYEVYYNTTDSIPDTPAQTVSTTSTVINNLTNGTNYYVWVMGKNSNGTSNTSTVVNGKPLGSPGTPEITPGFRQLTVSWTAVAGADEYEVYYGIGTPTTLAITTSGTSAIISGLTGGTTYHVRILAKNPNGISDFSPIINGTPNDSLSPGLYRNGDKVGNQNLAMSLTYISSNAISGDEFIIVLGGNESISPTNLGYSNNLVKITIQGYKEERKILLHSNGNLFNINHGVTLVLNENITLVGRSVGGNGNANNNVHLVRINNGGTLILNSEAKITNNTSNSTNSNNSAGGVRVKNGGIFFMHGGEISGNISSGNTFSDGGGVWVEEGGIFEMHGGRIFANRARYGGGVLNRGVFRISNGIIYGNEASVPLNLRNTATIGTDYSALIGTASYGIINDNNFNQLGILGNTNNTIHVVNGVLQYR
ncbi:MAG: fibronectin type III domain-containing protein, partial [Treponema sp.]|nr:fibronectin type III domain-containing protein [Treponema sp.]